jgi:hypothetical protein
MVIVAIAVDSMFTVNKPKDHINTHKTAGISTATVTADYKKGGLSIAKDESCMLIANFVVSKGIAVDYIPVSYFYRVALSTRSLSSLSFQASLVGSHLHSDLNEPPWLHCKWSNCLYSPVAYIWQTHCYRFQEACQAFSQRFHR